MTSTGNSWFFWPKIMKKGTKWAIIIKGPSNQISVHLGKWFQRRRYFRNRPIRNKNCMWRPCLLTHRAEMSNLYRGPSIYASYQVSVHIAMYIHMSFHFPFVRLLGVR
jgi:hypothetical protein